MNQATVAAAPTVHKQKMSFAEAFGRRASSSNAPLLPPPLYPAPTRRAFPRECRAILRLLGGNDRCFDCGKNSTSDAEERQSLEHWEEDSISEKEREPDLIFASAKYGTLLCRICAYRHVKKSEVRIFLGGIVLSLKHTPPPPFPRRMQPLL